MPENVDIDELEKSAALLLATAQTMAKGGFNMETGSITDERGDVSGKVAGDGDAGAVTDLMIGRAKAALTAMGKPTTPEMIGKMLAFMKGGDEDEDEDDMEAAYAKSEAFRKSADSFLREFTSDPEISDALSNSDAGPVITQMLGITAQTMAKVSHAQSRFAKSQVGFNNKLAPAFVALGREVRALAKSQALIMERLGIAERAPVAAPRAVKSPEDAMAKSGRQPGQRTDLTRDQLTGTLSYMGMMKGLRNVGHVDVLNKSALIAAGGSVEPDVYHVATEWLAAAGPAERNQALTFNQRT